jgi:histidinol-phosphate aminotransferase
MHKAVTPETKVIWIANPNNPTGTFIAYSEIKRFLSRVPKDVVVVLDEAYKEYLGGNDQADTAAWLKDYPNLIITRTFSKAYGLAGLRIGYGLASPEVAELLNRVRQPFNANSLALAAAAVALDDDDFIVRSNVANRTGRQQLLDGLKKSGLRCLPAYGNFVTFRVGNAAEIYRGLLKSGVIIRPLNGYGMPDWLRVTIGTQTDNVRFLAALKGVLMPGKG